MVNARHFAVRSEHYRQLAENESDQRSADNLFSISSMFFQMSTDLQNRERKIGSAAHPFGKVQSETLYVKLHRWTGLRLDKLDSREDDNHTKPASMSAAGLTAMKDVIFDAH